MGFDSVDGYQRAFRREYGCNPREYAKRPVPLYLFTPYGIKTQTVAKYLMFQSDPFKEDEFESAIEQIWQTEAKYNPEAIGYEFDKENPRIQLEPIGKRGYIEFVAINKGAVDSASFFLAILLVISRKLW